MAEEVLHTLSLHQLIDRLQQGDRAAQDDLVRRVAGRLERLTHKMLATFPGVRRFEQTGDVLQNGLMRLLHTLAKLKPADTRAFFGLAAEHLRRELIDLNRHYQGALGRGRHEVPQARSGRTDDSDAGFDPADATGGLEQLERWQAFHEAVAQLPVNEREVFGLVFYHGWTQPQIAELLQVAERTVRRYWQAACLHLHEALGGELPLA